MAKSTTVGRTMRYVSRTCCRIVGITASSRPAPIRLLTSALHVEAKAATTMNGMPEMLRITFVIANARSPRCSTKRKNKNHVEKDMKFCIIVQKDTFRMRRSFGQL